jgi:hypothetical protein
MIAALTTYLTSTAFSRRKKDVHQKNSGKAFQVPAFSFNPE